jgi:hypothetical protein
MHLKIGKSDTITLVTLYTINVVVEGTAKKRPTKLAIDESDTRTYIFRYIFTCICREEREREMIFIYPHGGEGCTEVGIMKSCTMRWASTGLRQNLHSNDFGV